MFEALAKKGLTLPNCITLMRIIGTIGMLFTKPFSTAFFVIYTLCGISDVLDGWIARTKNMTTELGAKLDSLADLLFYGVMAIMTMPVLWARLPMGIWYAVAAIVLLRIITYLMVAIKHKRFSAMHTYGNKITGVGVFGIPYFLPMECGVIYCCISCSVCALSTIEEFFIHLLSKKYNPKTKSILQLGR